MSSFAHRVLGLPERYVKTFYARTFADANAAASGFLKLHNAREVTSQHHETTGGWSCTIYYELPEPPRADDKSGEK